MNALLLLFTPAVPITRSPDGWWSHGDHSQASVPRMGAKSRDFGERAKNDLITITRHALRHQMTELEHPTEPFCLKLLGPFAASVKGAPLPPLRTRKDAW